MIQYKKSDGTLGSFESEDLHSIKSNNNTFLITLMRFGWDEYDYWFEEITDVVEIRIE